MSDLTREQATQVVSISNSGEWYSSAKSIYYSSPKPSDSEFGRLFFAPLLAPKRGCIGKSKRRQLIEAQKQLLAEYSSALETIEAENSAPQEAFLDKTKAILRKYSAKRTGEDSVHFADTDDFKYVSKNDNFKPSFITVMFTSDDAEDNYKLYSEFAGKLILCIHRRDQEVIKSANQKALDLLKNLLPEDRYDPEKEDAAELAGRLFTDLLLIEAVKANANDKDIIAELIGISNEELSPYERVKEAYRRCLKELIDSASDYYSINYVFEILKSTFTSSTGDDEAYGKHLFHLLGEKAKSVHAEARAAYAAIPLGSDEAKFNECNAKVIELAALYEDISEYSEIK